MARRAALLLLIASAVVVTASASARSSKSFPIRLGVGIGPINLGMTGQQVRRALGPPGAVLERRVIRGRPYIELQWGYGNWNVGLLGPKGRRRAVLVGTALTRHRTPDRIGVGSTDRQVARTYPGIRLRDCWVQRRSRWRHWVLPRGSAETVFIAVTKPERVYTSQPKLEVGAIEVRGTPVLGCVT